MRIGQLECFSGISGDMMLGALVDSGVPFSVLHETAAALRTATLKEVMQEARRIYAGSRAVVRGVRA